MTQVQVVWNKFNPRERLTVIGAIVLIVAWLVGAGLRTGLGSLGPIGAIAVIVILYLKYANPNISWPAPVSLLTLGISALVGLLALLTLIDWIGFLEFLGARGLLALAGNVIGAGLMVWGSFQEYQVEKPAMPNFGGSAAAPNAATPSATSAAPTMPPAAAPPAAAPPTAAPPTAAAPPPDVDDTLPR